jgi:hypothetical protein
VNERHPPHRRRGNFDIGRLTRDADHVGKISLVAVIGRDDLARLEEIVAGNESAVSGGSAVTSPTCTPRRPQSPPGGLGKSAEGRPL